VDADELLYGKPELEQWVNKRELFPDYGFTLQILE
jgi:hypothetical protein